MKVLPLTLLLTGTLCGILAHYALNTRNRSVQDDRGANPNGSPAKVQSVAMELPPRDVKEFISDLDFVQLVQVDAQSALRFVLNISDQALRAVALETLMRELADYNLARAKSLLSEFSGADKNIAVLAMLPCWAQNDPEGAWLWLMSVSDETIQIKYSELAIKEIGNSDVRKAAEMVAKIKPGRLRQRMLNLIGEQLANWDPKYAANYVYANLTSDNTYDNFRFQQVGIEKFALQNFYAATDWLKTLPAGQSKNQVASLIFRNVAANDLGSALEVFNELGDESAVYAAEQIAGIWGKQDPFAASRWIAGLGQSKAAEKSIKVLSSRWAAQSPDETYEWISALPSGVIRDQAAEAFVQETFRNNQVGAIEMAFTIDNSALKTTTLRWAILNWMRNEPSVAIKWVKDSNAISDEFRAEFLGGL